MSAISKLVEALKDANAPQEMIRKAEEGYYNDFRSPLATPIMQLVMDCRAYRLHDLAERAINGVFDGE